MKTTKRRILIALCLCCTFLFQGGCNNDDEESVSTVSVEVSGQTVNEKNGRLGINIRMSKASDKDTEVNFKVSGSVQLDGDYSLPRGSSIVIPAGETSYTIPIDLIDEQIIEALDTLTMTLRSTGANTTLSRNDDDLSTEILIEDNDQIPDDKLQIDLTWETGEGKSINLSNLDLYIAYDVLINDEETIEDFQILETSDGINSEGFETVFISNELSDRPYYLVIHYADGDVDTNFTLTLNGLGYDKTTTTGSFSASDITSAYFFGPFTKSGSNITYGRIRTNDLKGKLIEH